MMLFSGSPQNGHGSVILVVSIICVAPLAVWLAPVAVILATHG